MLVVAGMASFSGLRKADYVWDDRRALGLVDTADQPVAPSPADSIKQSWTLDVDKSFQPVTKTVWSLVQAVSPGQRTTPAVLHGLSFVLHMASSLLVMLILTFVLQSSGAA